jgi:hypothetical protein
MRHWVRCHGSGERHDPRCNDHFPHAPGLPAWGFKSINEVCAMAMIRFRLTGDRSAADTVIAGLHGINGIEHVEEIDDLTPGMREDSSSSDSISDSESKMYYIEVEAATDMIADKVRGSAEVIATDCEAGIEFVDEF